MNSILVCNLYSMFINPTLSAFPYIFTIPDFFRLSPINPHFVNTATMAYTVMSCKTDMLCYCSYKVIKATVTIVDSNLHCCSDKYSTRHPNL